MSNTPEIPSRYDSLSLEFKKVMSTEAPHIFQMGSAHAATEAEATKRAYREADMDRPTNEELRGWMDSFLPNSSQHYLGILPLTAQSQTPSVHLQASNCWKTHRYAVPKEFPSYRKVNAHLEQKYKE